ncbi:MAG: TonB-dependent receptor, partial [Gemmatimonadetes bacterium]
FGYRYGAAEDQNRWSGRLFGRQGRLSYHFGATLRSAGAYEAPAGTFGNITLSDETPVNNTGVDDRNFDLRLGLEIAPGQQLTARYEGYRAEDAGFGDVDPARYAQGLPEITILYPDQNVDKFTFGYEGLDLGWALADRLDARAFVVDNDRELTLNFFQSFGPQAPPGAGVSIENRNFTDITTAGFRAEARKAAGARALFTYGVDFSRDDSEGTDLSTTVVSGFGPPMETVVDRPQIPNATFRRLGVFVQSEIEFSDRFSVIAGGRFEDIRAETERTEGLEDPPVSRSDRTVVGSLNALFDVNDQVALVASIGRAFRSPNLIERFFNGPTPEGSGFQVRNPDLDAETSFNVDLGIRFRNRWVEAEAFGFRNKIFDGVRVRALGREEQGLPAFQNVNVDELLYRGVELAATVYPGAGLSVGGTFTHLDSEDVNDPENPVGDSFSNKLTGRVR